MGAMSKRKGKVGEREIALLLRSEGFPARRGVQYHGGPESSDIACECLPTVHFEVKRCERLDLYGSLEQAQTDAGAKLPIVVHRKNDCDWVAILDLRLLLNLMRDAGLVVHPEPAVEQDWDVEADTGTLGAGV